MNDGSMAGTFTSPDAETKVVCENGTLSGAPGPCASSSTLSLD